MPVTISRIRSCGTKPQLPNAVYGPACRAVVLSEGWPRPELKRRRERPLRIRQWPDLRPSKRPYFAFAATPGFEGLRFSLCCGVGPS
jgi:hypothetical protein